MRTRGRHKNQFRKLQKFYLHNDTKVTKNLSYHASFSLAPIHLPLSMYVDRVGRIIKSRHQKVERSGARLPDFNFCRDKDDWKRRKKRIGEGRKGGRKEGTCQRLVYGPGSTSVPVVQTTIDALDWSER